MNIFRLTKEDARLFTRLDPYGWLSLLECPGAFALGCIQDETDSPQPDAGLLIASATKRDITIHWLAVGEAAEGMGIGSALLKRMFETAVSAGIPRLGVLMAPLYKKEPFFAGVENYFEERFFTDKAVLPGIWQGTLFQLMQGKAFQNPPANLPEAVPLSNYPYSVQADMIRQLLDLDGHMNSFDITAGPGAYDPQLSYVILDEGNAWGGLIVRRLSESLLPVYFYADSMPEAQALALGAVKKAVSIFGEEMSADIILTGRSSKDDYLWKKNGSRDKSEAWENAVEYASELLPESAKGGLILGALTKQYQEFQDEILRNI